MQVIHPTNLTFNCTKCGRCCGDTETKTRHILLLPSDAQIIETQTKKNVTSFADPTANKAPYIYEMKKNPETGKCVFLKDNECIVYEYRPLICRFYPFELSTSREGECIFTFTVECPSITQGVQKKHEGTLGEDFFQKLLKIAYNRMTDCSE